jgi:hypothetical protein
MADITATQQFTATIKITNRKGGPAQVDGIPTWAVENPTVASITPAADGLSALIVAQGVGTSKYNVNADADLGAGVVPIIGEGTVNVSPGVATTISLTEGPAEEQP